MTQVLNTQHIQDEMEAVCAECGARCCKPLIMCKNPFGLILKEGDSATMYNNGLITFIQNHFTLTEEGGERELEEHIIRPHIFGYCPFLNYETNKCSIYSERPDTCKSFPYGITSYVHHTKRKIAKQVLPTGMGIFGNKGYDLSICSLVTNQQRNHPHYFKFQEEQEIQQFSQQFTKLVTKPFQRSPDKDALIQSLHYNFPYEILELIKAGARQTLLKEYQQSYPFIVHNYHSDNWGSYIISGNIHLIPWITQKLMKLVEAYQSYFKRNSTILTITVMDDKIVKQAAQMAPSKQDQLSIKYIPIYRIRGVFAPNTAEITEEDTWKIVQEKHNNFKPDGSLLSGVIFAHELEKPVSYWEKCWTELKDLHRRTGINPHQSFSLEKSPQQKRPSTPFKPKRRRRSF